MTTPLAPGDRYLTPNFRLSEFAVSASHRDLVVPVPKHLQPSAQLLAEQLEIIRGKVARPMTILSGYRNRTLNKAVGGSNTSQHTEMQAVDWTCTRIRDAFEDVIDLVKSDRLPHVGQLIYYPTQGFVHLALPSRRFPRATVCVHWPEQGMKYRPIGPTRYALEQVVPRSVTSPTTTADVAVGAED